MDDNEFWIKCWKYAAITSCIVLISGISSCQSTKYQIRKMVEAGASPIEAACAYDLGDSSITPALCVVEKMGAK